MPFAGASPLAGLWSAIYCNIAPILQKHGEWTIGGFAAANLVGLAVLVWFPSRPGHHDPDLADAHVAAEYPALLQSARVLLPLSYVLISAVSPILPYRFEALGVAGNVVALADAR